MFDQVEDAEIVVGKTLTDGIEEDEVQKRRRKSFIWFSYLNM